MTGIVTIIVDDIEREMTEQELTVVENTRTLYQNDYEKQKSKEQKIELQRQTALTKLTELGLTLDDLSALGLITLNENDAETV